MATSSKFLPEPKMKTTEPSVDEVGGGMKSGGKMAAKYMSFSKTGTPAGMKSVTKMAKGGEVESKSMQKREMGEMKKVEKELKHHESMKASKAHNGLKKGGMPSMGNMAPKAGPNQMSGLAGGLSATRPVRKPMTGGIEMTGYKMGGKINVNDKVVSAKQTKSFNTKTGVIKQKSAGYKDGGQVSHQAMKCDSQDGFKALKKGGKCNY